MVEERTMACVHVPLRVRVGQTAGEGRGERKCTAVEELDYAALSGRDEGKREQRNCVGNEEQEKHEGMMVEEVA
jgi:hypothetical protein